MKTSHQFRLYFIYSHTTTRLTPITTTSTIWCNWLIGSANHPKWMQQKRQMANERSLFGSCVTTLKMPISSKPHTFQLSSSFLTHKYWKNNNIFKSKSDYLAQNSRWTAQNEREIDREREAEKNIREHLYTTHHLCSFQLRNISVVYKLCSGFYGCDPQDIVQRLKFRMTKDGDKGVNNCLMATKKRIRFCYAIYSREPWALQVYLRFRCMLRLKNPEQPIELVKASSIVD